MKGRPLFAESVREKEEYFIEERHESREAPHQVHGIEHRRNQNELCYSIREVARQVHRQSAGVAVRDDRYHFNGAYNLIQATAVVLEQGCGR